MKCGLLHGTPQKPTECLPSAAWSCSSACLLVSTSWQLTLTRPHGTPNTESELPGTMPILSPFPHRRGLSLLAPIWAFPGVLEQELRLSCRKTQAPVNYGAVIPSRASEEIVNLHPKPLQPPHLTPGLSLFRMIYKSIILRQNCLLVHIIQIFKYNSIRLSLASS